jgi:hypothetical protein
MTQLIQLVYISRSSFAGPENFRGGVEPNAGKILLQARVNNRKTGLTGVLCFGDGCFLQCLEGEEESVSLNVANLPMAQKVAEVLPPQDDLFGGNVA